MPARDKLKEQFPEAVLKSVDKGGGRTATYIPQAEIITRLNDALTTEGWSYTVLRAERDATDPDWVIAHVRICARLDGVECTRDGLGGAAVKRTSKKANKQTGEVYDEGGRIVDLGDDFKSAVSDALKKAAMSLGVGLDLARSDEAIAASRALVPSTSEQHERIRTEAGRRPTVNLDEILAKKGLDSLEALNDYQAETLLAFIGTFPLSLPTSDEPTTDGSSDTDDPVPVASEAPTASTESAEEATGTSSADEPTDLDEKGWRSDVTDEQVAEILQKAHRAGVDVAAICKGAHVERIQQITPSQYTSIVRQLDGKLKVLERKAKSEQKAATAKAS